MRSRQVEETMRSKETSNGIVRRHVIEYRIGNGKFLYEMWRKRAVACGVVAK
jgi:hypothetical protein